MSKLSQLYQQVIIDHSKNPRNFGSLPSHTHSCNGHNPLCGDSISVYLILKDDLVEDVKFEGSGCSISQASASMMTQALKGKTQTEALQLFHEFQQMILGELDPNEDKHHLGKLAIFAGVREYPSRAKCATLAWHTMHGAINAEQQEITTE